MYKQYVCVLAFGIGLYVMVEEGRGEERSIASHRIACLLALYRTEGGRCINNRSVVRYARNGRLRNVLMSKHAPAIAVF